MGTLTVTVRIGLAVVFSTFLMWLPGQPPGGGCGWGLTPCSGQEPGGGELNPENLLAGTFGGNSFTARLSILNNTVADVNGNYRVQILNAFQGFKGIAQVNQAAGTLNNQVAYVGMAGFRDGAQTTGHSLSYGSQVRGNTLTTSNNTYQADIKGPSFAIGSGIALVNQTAGHMNTQMNAVSVVVGKQGTENLTDLQMGAISSNNLLTSNPQAPNSRSTRLEMDKGAFQDFTGIWSTNQIAGNMDQVTTIFNVRVTTVP